MMIAEFPRGGIVQPLQKGHKNSIETCERCIADLRAQIANAELWIAWYESEIGERKLEAMRDDGRT